MVVPTVGRVELLERCLKSVLDCRPGPAEVLVVDQSRGDRVAQLIARLAHPGLRRVEDTGRGIGRALNTGLRTAQHELVLVTHDDCRVAVDWVGVAVGVLTARPSLLLTGRVEPATDVGHVPSCKTDPTVEEHEGGFRYDLLYCNNWGAMRRAVVEIGGFDERAGLRLAAEDCDLCFRWTASGRPVRYDPAMVVWHEDWRSEATLRRTYRTYGRGLGVFYAKHLMQGRRELVRHLGRDLARGARHSWRGRRRGEPAGLDPDRGLLPGVPIGVATGVVEELLRRRRRGDAR